VQSDRIEEDQVKLVWPERRSDGVVFYDVHGYKYLFNTGTNKVSQLTFEPDTRALAEMKSYAGSIGDPFYRPTVVICGEGIFARISKLNDPREISKIEYYGDLMYNMEADADLNYLVISDITFSSDGTDAFCGNFTIRGDFKRIAILDSFIADTKLTIISKTNPEIFIIGSNMNKSSIHIVDYNGEPYNVDKIRIAEREVSADERRAILEYVRSDSRDVLESETDCESSGFGANIAAWLAVAGLVAAASPKKRIKRHIQKKVHQSQVFYK